MPRAPRTSRSPRYGALAAVTGVAAMATIAAAAVPGDTTADPSSVHGPERVASAQVLADPLPLSEQLLVAAGLDEARTAPTPVPAGPDYSRLQEDRAVAAAEAFVEPAAVEPVAPAPAEPARTVWDDLADCEAGAWLAGGGFATDSADWASTAGTFEGGLQFQPSTWDAFRDAEMPEAAYDATREQQIVVGERVLDAQGWGAWPVCSRKLGLR